MKVLFTIDSLQQGGAEQSIASIIKYFSKDTQTVVLYFYPKADLLSTYQQLDCKVISAGLQGKYDWKKGIRFLRKVIREEQPDIVVTSLYRSNIMSRIACFLENKRLVGTFVDDSYNDERKKSFRGIGRLKYLVTKWMDRFSARLCYGWISNSASIGENNARHLWLDRSRIKVIYRGRDSREFPAWQSPKHDTFKFIAIGRLYDKKGYPELLEAFSLLIHQHRQASLEIFGEGPYRKEMEAFIEKNGMTHHCHLRGNVAGAWKKIYDADCFVFPSRYEGFSGALVEAMMTGVPIISSDIPMNLEAVEHEQTALVHQLRNHHDLYEQMKRMMTEKEAMMEMGKRARSVAIEKYDIRNIARQYEDQLRRFVKGV